MAVISRVKLPSDEHHWTLVMISQCWCRLGAIRQQAITGANVDPDLRRHMVSLGYNELIEICQDLNDVFGQLSNAPAKNHAPS